MKGFPMQDHRPDPLTVPLREAIRLLGINRTRAYNLIGGGFLDARKGGRQTLITMASIRAYASVLPRAKIGGGVGNQM